MTPWQKAYQHAMECGISPEHWQQRMEWCLNYGYVISTPNEFIAFHEAEHNGEPAWFVAIAAGGSGNVVHRFLRYMIEPRKWVLWSRHNEERIRVFAWDKLARKAGLK